MMYGENDILPPDEWLKGVDLNDKKYTETIKNATYLPYILYNN